MAEPNEYKPTMMDRHGAGAVDVIKAYVWGAAVFAISFAAFGLQGGLNIFTFLGSLLAGLGTAWLALGLSGAVGWTWKRFMVDGTSTPYVEQYSYQQALVMQGKLDEALESFEAVIAEKPQAVDPRVKAAELYDRDRKNHVRAAELFREVQRIEGVTPGEFIYATNRLVDLYTGPLGDPGRALVELRKLIDRYPGSGAAIQAKHALETLKARHTPAEPL